MSASAGRVLLIPKGEYDSATEYYMLDLVTYLGSSYVCKATTTGNDPTNTTYWQLHSAGKENVSDMNDVDLTSVADGEELSYDETAGKWKNTSRLLSLESVADISAASKVIDFSSIISITDALPIPAKDVKLKVEPVQDLHGYDKPWVGGAGKNKVNYNAWKTVDIDHGTAVWENNGVTLTATSNDCFTKYTASDFPVDARVPISEGQTVTLSWKETQNIDGVIFIFPNGTTTGMANINNKDGKTLSYTATSGVTFITYRFSVSHQGDTASFKDIQLEFGSTATAWEPYTNICPISGHSEAKITRAGKNLLPLTVAYIKANNTGGTWSGNKYTRNNVSYTLNADNDGNVQSIVVDTAGGTASAYTALRIADLAGTLINGTYVLTDDLPSYNSQVRLIVYNNTTSTTAAIAGNSPNFTYNGSDTCRGNIEVFSGASASNVVFKPMISIDGGAYEPYKGNVYTIDLDGTRYGGVLDVDAGTLTLDRVYEEHTIDSIYQRSGNANCDFGTFTLSEAIPDNMYASTIVILDKGRYYNNVTENFDNISQPGVVAVYSQANKQLAISVPKGTSLADAQAMFGTIGIVYPLATPTTVQLTPTEVMMLQGANVLSGDTGDISLTYDPETIGNISESIGDLWAAISALEARVTELET